MLSTEFHIKWTTREMESDQSVVGDQESSKVLMRHFLDYHVIMHDDHQGGQESSKRFFRLSPYHDQINKQVVYVGVHARRGDRLQVCSDSNLDFPVIAKIQR